MIRVLSPGFYTTIQDRGRFGYADIGVPSSGMMDRYSGQLANQIIGNNENDSVLEICLSGCVLKFEKQSVICVSGADFSPKINSDFISLNKPVFVNKNDILSFGKKRYGTRIYLAVKGGFQTSVKLGSRSFYAGITSQVLIKKNDVLPIERLSTDKFSLNVTVKVDKNHFKNRRLLVYPGPEFDLLNLKQKTQLEKQVFTISKDNNRMGYRLEEHLENQLPSILTSSVLPGTVQLTPSGKIIILMRDCQVTGGYPRVLQLSEMAINRLAQKSTGDTIQFIIEGLNV